MIASTQSFSTQPLNHLHAAFLLLLPKVQTHARIQFRGIACPDKRADKIAECLALAWAWYVRLCERGKDVSRFQTTFASLVVRAVRSGRKVTGTERARDVMSPPAQQRHGFSVESLPSSLARSHETLNAIAGQQLLDTFEERLHDNTITPVPDQVQFRIDFPAWLQTLTARERRMIRRMARNERTKDLAKTFEVSPGRISQMRREFKQGWERYCGDNVEESVAEA